jgi:hypothetical protein
MNETHDHWQRVYSEKAETSVSWYQPTSVRSLTAIREAAPGLDASIIDIGGGASTLVDGLLEAGYTDITVLDIADVALEKSKARLGVCAARTSWIAADIMTWSPPRTWDVWHDRAVFHFLTTNESQTRYLDALQRGTHPGSHVIISTFALDGPERCSGLPVQRYSAQTLALRLGERFTMIAHDHKAHVTPWGATQSFIYANFLRR